MLPHIGIPELLLILGIFLVVFGPRKLPEVGRSLGMTLREFRKSTREEATGLKTPETIGEIDNANKA